MTAKSRQTETEREADRQAGLARAGKADETAGRPEARDDRTAEQRAGSNTEAAQEAASAPPSTPPAAANPEPVRVRETTITTLGEVMHETRPGFDAGGTPVIPNGPPRNRLAEIGDYPRSYEDAVFLERHRAGEVDEYGRQRAEDDDRDQVEDDAQRTEGRPGETPRAEGKQG